MAHSDYHPLTVGNRWTYQMKDGKTFTNTVKALGASPQEFLMGNSMMDRDVSVTKEGTIYSADHFEAGNRQVFLRDDLKTGDSWEVKFKANNFDNILVMTVKDIGVSREVEGRSYPEVVQIEAESRMIVNGNVMPLHFFTQYYYAKGVGLILTTSSAGDSMGLVSWEVR